MNNISNDYSIKESKQYYLKPGYIYVAIEPTIITTVLGSCVSICMHDKKKRYGGMNHFLYPRKEENNLSTAKYGDISTLALIKTFKEFGSEFEDLVVHIIGAGYLKDSENSKLLARENIRVCKEILKRYNIKIMSENLGGEEGRKAIFYSECNKIEIAYIKKISNQNLFI